MHPKILFLDIDGVLNSEQSAIYHHERHMANGGFHKWAVDGACPIAASNLRSLIKEFPDLRIVVSSTWRYGQTVKQLRETLWTYAKLPRYTIIDKTPSFKEGPRGDEIAAWLKENPTKKFVILDDDSDMSVVQDHLVWTSWREGLMRKHVITIMNMFAEPWRFGQGVDLFEAKNEGLVDHSIQVVNDDEVITTYWGKGNPEGEFTQHLEAWALVKTLEREKPRLWKVFVKAGGTP